MRTKNGSQEDKVSGAGIVVCRCTCESVACVRACKCVIGPILRTPAGVTGSILLNGWLKRSALRGRGAHRTRRPAHPTNIKILTRVFCDREK